MNPFRFWVHMMRSAGWLGRVPKFLQMLKKNPSAYSENNFWGQHVTAFESCKVMKHSGNDLIKCIRSCMNSLAGFSRYHVMWPREPPCTLAKFWWQLEEYLEGPVTAWWEHKEIHKIICLMVNMWTSRFMCRVLHSERKGFRPHILWMFPTLLMIKHKVNLRW